MPGCYVDSESRFEAYRQRPRDRASYVVEMQVKFVSKIFKNFDKIW
jgi:hypothetical protein